MFFARCLVPRHDRLKVVHWDFSIQVIVIPRHEGSITMVANFHIGPYYKILVQDSLFWPAQVSFVFANFLFLSLL